MESVEQSFLSFLKRARPMLAPTGGVQAQFRDADLGPGDKLIARFESFVQGATAMLYAEVIEHSAPLVRFAERLRDFPNPPLLLETVGMRRSEAACNRLMGWLLSPKANQDLAVRLQRRLLKHLHIPHPEPFFACEPSLEDWVGQGRVDLVLRYPGLAVLVESKVDSFEHGVSDTDEPQTLHYESHALRSLNLEAVTRLAMVFLTPERASAENPEARPLSWIDLARLLVEEAPQPSETVASVARYWLRNAAPRGLSVEETLEKILALAGAGGRGPNPTGTLLQDILRTRAALTDEPTP